MRSSGSNNESAGKKKTREIEPPVCLGDLFAENDEETEEAAFSQLYEVQELDIGGSIFKVRQFAWHRANANKVWPGTFNLGEYICLNKEKYGSYPILELGAATGALSVYLSAPPFHFKVSTSDIDDGGEVEENIYHNFELNGLSRVLHIPHTWGTGWDDSCQRASKSIVGELPPRFKFIIASDILLYVSAYPALVQTLCEIFEIKVKLGSQRLYGDSNCPSKKEVARAPQKTQKTIQKSNVDIMVELWEDEDEIHPESADDAVADLISVGIIPGVETESNADEDCVDFCIIPCADAIMLPDITRRRGESRESNSGSICKSPGEKTISENTEEDAGGRKTPESVEVEVVMGELVDEDDLDAVVAATVCDSDGEFEEEPESEIREAETIYSALRKSTITPVKAESNTVKSSSSDLPHKGLQDLGTVSGAETEIKSKGLNCGMGGGTVGYTGPPVEFLMSWNRRIAESAIFFDLMTSAGFVCEHKGKCVYSFTVKDSNDI